MSMFHKMFATALLLGAGSSVHGAITGMFDASGTPMVARLIAGTGLGSGDVSALSYVGATANGVAQGGLFDQLVLHGQNSTTLTLGPGIVLTSGFVTGLPTTNTLPYYGGMTNTGGENYFRDFPTTATTGRHAGRLDEHDENVLSFTLNVPANAVGVKAQFVYASEEFPEWSGTQYADGFGFFVEGKNYATLPDGTPVSLLKQETNIHFMANGYPNGTDDATAQSVADIEYDGLTRVLELVAPVRGGRGNDFTLVVADTGDQIYDSAVFLTGFEFLYGDPIDETGVKVRHQSEDDAFVEFEHGVAVPEPGTIGAGLVCMAGLWLRRRRRTS